MAITSAEATLGEWAAAWSASDPERLTAIFTDDCVYEDVTMGVLTHGRAELRDFAGGIFAAIPDFAIELSSRFAAGGWGGMEWTMSGTHRGDLPGLPATGKPFTLRGLVDPQAVFRPDRALHGLLGHDGVPEANRCDAVRVKGQTTWPR